MQSNLANSLPYPKKKEVLDFVTEADQLFVDSLPGIRKFVRLALPGEVDGKQAVFTLRFILQNDEGALFKGLLWPPWGQYTCGDLNQFMLLNECDLEGLFYKSYKITMEQDVKYTWQQQEAQLYRGIIDTMCFYDFKQIDWRIWFDLNKEKTLYCACAPVKTKSKHHLFFFQTPRSKFHESADVDGPEYWINNRL